MRQYASPAAFRAAVEERLRTHARSVGAPVMIVRRQAALERLMPRLTRVAPGRWALKGGLALETRLGERARASMDMDIDHQEGAAAARQDLLRAITEDLGDHFTFAIAGSRELRDGEVSLAERYRMECALAGTLFETLQVDVTVTAPDEWEIEPGRRCGLLAEVGLGPIDVPLVPLERQVAEKLHAYTRPYDGGSTRTKDLVDFVVIRLFERVDAARLEHAITQTFTRRGTHPVPARLSAPPGAWQVAYREEAEAVGLRRTWPRRTGWRRRGWIPCFKEPRVGSGAPNKGRGRGSSNGLTVGKVKPVRQPKYQDIWPAGAPGELRPGLSH